MASSETQGNAFDNACNDDWVFNEGFSPDLTTTLGQGEPSRCRTPPSNCPSPISTRRPISAPSPIRSSSPPIRHGTARRSRCSSTAPWPTPVVYLNGEEIGVHKDGYTPFEARLTGRLKAGENLLAVTIDGSENPDIPPFGGLIDYLTYAGIYRDVWLKVPSRSRSPASRSRPRTCSPPESASASASRSTIRRTCRSPAR